MNKMLPPVCNKNTRRHEWLMMSRFCISICINVTWGKLSYHDNEEVKHAHPAQFALNQGHQVLEGGDDRNASIYI